SLRRSGIIVIVNARHIASPEDLVLIMRMIHEEGWIPECTFRIDIGILREAMTELRAFRDEKSSDADPVILGVGSLINPRELEAALEMGFDMVVAPANVMGGCGHAADFVRLCH